MKFYSARQAIHDAYAIHLRSKGFDVNQVSFRSGNGSQKQNNDYRICDAVEAGKVIAAVEGLEEPFRSWAKWAYGPRTQEFLPEQARFFEWLDRNVADNFDSIDRDYRKVTKQKIRDVVAYTVLDYRSFSINGQHLYPASLVINRCKIHRQNWKRDFLPWHGHFWNICDEFLDRACLPPVAGVVGKFR